MTSLKRPEVLAPAGDRGSLEAAVRAGADAVYFGLQGFNARARATNFDAAELGKTLHWLHERGVRFHESILAGSRNPFFLEALRRINRVRRLLSYRSMVVRDRYRDQCRDHLEILIWERGAGHTLSSGTGACASAVAAALNGLSDRSVTVKTEGGVLRVDWREDDTVALTGAAEVIYEGRWLRG